MFDDERGCGNGTKLVYFAGPLFSQAELRFNADLTAKLEALRV